MTDVSDGRSLLNPDQDREGIVIRPWLPSHNELVVRGVGRPLLKQRSPAYLAKSDL